MVEFDHPNRLCEHVATLQEMSPSLFTLEDLGIEEGELIGALAPTFSALPYDEYDIRRHQLELLTQHHPAASSRIRRFFAEYYGGRSRLDELQDLISLLPESARTAFAHLQPYRRRAIAEFCLTHSNNGWRIEPIPPRPFTQSVSPSDYRSLERRFAQIPESITSHPSFQALLTRIAEMIESLLPTIGTMNVTAHQIRTIARPNNPGQSSPEGLHQDGVDYVVSAIVMAKANVIGGESIICPANNPSEESCRVNLGIGQGLFHSDHLFLHNVTPIRLEPCTTVAEGTRDIIGFDIITLQ